MQDDPFARAVARTKAAEQAEAAAKRDRVTRHVRSGAQTALRTHASVFVMVNLLLVIIWATTSAGYPWFLYPLFGWGIGLAAHWSATSSLTKRRERRTYDGGLGSVPPAPPRTPPIPAAAPAPSVDAGSTSGELAKLAKLHKSGALSDEEFSAAKAKLLR